MRGRRFKYVRVEFITREDRERLERDFRAVKTLHEPETSSWEEKFRSANRSSTPQGPLAGTGPLAAEGMVSPIVQAGLGSSPKPAFKGLLTLPYNDERRSREDTEEMAAEVVAYPAVSQLAADEGFDKRREIHDAREHRQLENGEDLSSPGTHA